MLTPTKMKIIIASVSTVGLGAGTAGVVYGLTKPTKKEEIIVPEPVPVPTEGHTLHIKYANAPEGDDITTYKGLVTADEMTIKTIASLPFDDPTDTDHHKKMLTKITDQPGGGQIIYEPSTTYTDITLEQDTTWYVNLSDSHYHVYLHKWKSTDVYNPSDWYPTKAYDKDTVGFTQRSAPTELTNYEFLGWQLSTSDTATATTKEECLYGLDESPRDDKNGNRWPVIPDTMHLTKGDDPIAREWHLHPIYELKTTTFSFYDANDPTKTISKDADRPAVIKEGSREKFADPVVDHYHFDHWEFKEDTKMKIGGVEQTINAGTQFDDSYLGNNVQYLTPNISLLATLDKYQHCATFIMSDIDETIKTAVWVDIDDESKKAQITERNLPKDPTSSDPTKKFKYWTNKDGQQIDWSKEFLTDDSTIYKPHFEETTATLSVDFPENTKWTDGIQEVEATDIETINLFAGTDGYRYTIEEITNEVKKAANKEGWELKGPDGTPDFYGWLINNKLQDSYALNEGTNTAVANFNDAKNVKVTFNTDAGSFVCTSKSTSEEIKANSITCTLNIDDNKNIEDAYKTACAANDSHTEIKFIYDGYELSNQQEGEYYSCWEFEGSDLPKSYIVTKSMAVFAIYNEKTPTNWWDDDWNTIASVANKGNAEMQKVYKDVYEGTKADKEGKVTKNANSWVGLEKEVSVSGYSSESFTTRIIGVEQDMISNTENKALLTFDFVDCPFTGQYGDTNDYMNGFESSTLKGIFKSALPDGIKNNMLTVKKDVVQSVSDTAETKIQVKHFNTDLFLLSATEIGSCSNATTVSTDNSAAEIEAECPDSTFFTYDYYALHRTVDSDSSGRTEENEYRLKTYNGSEISWWLRTPGNKAYHLPETGEGDSYHTNAFYVTANESSSASKPQHGGIYDYVTTGARGISPVFCLGGPIN